jgi:type II secretion system protein G
MNKKKKTGFTLVELLIVIVLLGVLSVLGMSLYTGSQIRARDTRRKTDLSQIASALEMYALDVGDYPASDNGKIKGCGSSTALAACEWNMLWSRTVVGTPETIVYMQKLPKDPSRFTYCYTKLAKGYKLYANLEGTDDLDRVAPVACGSGTYTYVYRSTNLLPTEL